MIAEIAGGAVAVALLSHCAGRTGANGKPTDASAFAKKAIEQLVAFVPGAPFHAEKPDVSTLRLSFATANVEKIEEGIARLGKAL